MSAPYPYNSVPLSPRRRQHAAQPPNLLTTSLGNARNAGLGIGSVPQTPISTTSLSSPFSAYTQSPHPASPGGAMRGPSPIAFRSGTSFPAAYNPQQWGPLNNTSPSTTSTSQSRRQRHQTLRVAELAARPVGPDEPVASPPPPYSPRRNQDQQASPGHAADTLSPADTTSPDTESSRFGTPVSAATTLSPDLVSGHSGSRTPKTPSLPSSESPQTLSISSFPPPPSTQGPHQRTRATSKIHTDGLHSSLTSKGKALNTASPISAIDALQENSTHSLAQAPGAASSDPALRAPAAKRAASTGCIGLAGGASRSASHCPSSTTWEPGMSLPPPPPGPPPATARSQSLNRPIESPLSGLAPTLPLRSRRPPGNGTTLDTIPPTPADWREGDSSTLRENSRNRSQGPPPLHIETGSMLRKKRSGFDDPTSAIAGPPLHTRRDSSTGGLFRSPAVRNRSGKGIRERRSESKNGKGRADEDSALAGYNDVPPWAKDTNDVGPTDLVLRSGEVVVPSQRIISKSAPKSGRSIQSLDGAMKSAELRLPSGKAVSWESAYPAHQASARAEYTSQALTSPLPFSPGRGTFMHSPPATIESPAMPANPLTTSASQQCSEPSSLLPMKVSPGTEERPISHLLHMPNSDDSMQVPLTPLTKASQIPLDDLLGPESPRAFAGRAIERHRNFAQREAAAANDSERLDLFVQFMRAESRIRRDQYNSTFEEEDIEVGDLLHGFFAPSTSDEKFHEKLRDVPGQDSSRRTSIASSALIDSSSQDESSLSRKQESPSSFTTNSSAQNRPESAWMNEYVPCLSPIASMSITTGQDEIDSRGRAPSRWWEDRSHSGEPVQGDAFHVLGRSKRESKYMGVPPEARNSPALYEHRISGDANSVQWQRGEASHQRSYGPDEYPLEKVGCHEEASSVVPPSAKPPTPASAAYTPDSRRLDISRLVTLPPPFPRHHPAVNNGHPDLADTRAVVRSLHENVEAENIRESYRSQILGKRQRSDSWCKHQRSLHQQDVQFRIEHGEMTQMAFEEAEADLESKIAKSEKEITQTDFDLFQNLVVSPLHALFASRITRATITLDKLSSRLFTDAQSHSPNLPQEEGDEQPELLEKLTQLKWLFEARESLHRQTYDLLSDRNDKYKAIILLPYQQSQNPEKYADAEAFFAKDALDRKRMFEKAVSDRDQAFLSVIENNVSRGVEIQLSAFWDIAPSLLELLFKIPRDLEGFEIRIPADEYVENPSYYDHPLQYLYSLLGHAEKSTYQFIESQVNLFCLLHEIRSSALVARLRVEGRDDGEREREEKRLTEDLKEKVGVVEVQWEEALGGELMGVRERVRGILLEEGGWGDEEEEVV